MRQITTRTVDVIGHFGGRNLGDELMLSGLEGLIGRVDRGVEVRSWAMGDAPALLRSIASRRRGHLVIVSGSTFHDYYPSGARNRRQQVVKAAYVSMARAAGARGWSVTFVGSLGPSWRPASVALDRQLVRACDALLLRDARSLAEVRSHLRLRSEAHLVPDVALPAIESGLARMRPPVAVGDVSGGVDHAPASGYHVARALVCPVVDRQFPEWMYPEPDVTIRALTEVGIEAVTVASAASASATDGDAAAVDALRRAADRYGLPCQVEEAEIRPGPAGVDDAIAAFSSYRLVLSSRLHPGLVAVGIGVPTVLAPYHPKVREVVSTPFDDVTYLEPHPDVEEVARAIHRAWDVPARLRADAPEWREDLLGLLVG